MSNVRSTGPEIVLTHPDGEVRVREAGEGKREIRVFPRRPDVFVATAAWHTAYDLPLIKRVLTLKGPGWLCDEIRRDEDPAYVENDLRHDLFSYVDPAHLGGTRVLDFGCGCGASAAVLSRLAPGCRITGVELEPEFAAVARLRVEHHGLRDVAILESPGPQDVPAGLPAFDYILFSAVFEHLLPAERRTLMPRIWRLLKPGGILFLNQTPHRFFPIEGHTTGLPMINYLPGPAAGFLARRFSRRVAPDAAWTDLLRDGIRGGTPREIGRTLAGEADPPEFLVPRREGVRDHLELWYRSARIRHPGRGLNLRRGALALVRAVTGATVVPNLSLALRKPEA